MKSPGKVWFVRNKRKCVLTSLVAAFLLIGCKSSAPIRPSQQTADDKLTEWSWLPASHGHDAELAQLPKDADFQMYIPKDEPLATKSTGWGKVGASFEFLPIEKKSYEVLGGTLVSKVGAIEKKAKWGDWDFVYESARKEQIPRPHWGYCLTSGEVLLPRTVFLSPPSDAYVENSFEIESFGDSYVLLHLDPAKAHRLCFLQAGRLQLPTAGYIGTKAEIGGKILLRKNDGWYSSNVKADGTIDSQRMSQANSSVDLKQVYAKAEDKPDVGSGGGPTMMILSEKTTTDNPLFVSKDFDFLVNSENPGQPRRGYVQSEGWLAYSPPISASDKKAALVTTPQGRMIAGNLLLAYKIDRERRWGFIDWKE